MKYQLIVFFGPPGSGKGTQARILDTEYKYVQLGMSDMLLESVKNHQDIKSEQKMIERIEKDFDSGDLVAFEDVVYIMELNFVKNIRNDKKITLDGFPRTENQALWLSGLITKEKVRTLLIHFDLGLDIVLDRIENRFFLKSSNKIFSSYDNAKKEAINGEEPFRRNLDLDTKIIKKRYNEQYYNEKDQIIKAIESNTFVDFVSINANDDIKDISKIIKDNL